MEVCTSRIVTGNLAHDLDLQRAEMVRQAALQAPGLTQAAARQADITYAQTCLASSIAKNNGANAAHFGLGVTATHCRPGKGKRDARPVDRGP